MNKESANWCRLAQLIINKGGEVVRKFLVLEILTSIFTNYSQHWSENVQNPGDIKYSALLWKTLRKNLNSAPSSENILIDLLNSWNRSRRSKVTTVKEEIDRLKHWEKDIEKQLVSSVSNDVRTTLDSWLSQVQQEILKLNSMCSVLTQWNDTFLCHVYSAQHSLLLEIEESDKFISHCSATLMLLSPLSSTIVFQTLVQSYTKDLNNWKTKCHVVLWSFEQGCNDLIMSLKREAQSLPQRDVLVTFLDGFKAEISNENVNSHVDFFCGEWYNELKKVFEKYDKQTREGHSTSSVLAVAQELLKELKEFSFKEQKIRDFFIQRVFDSTSLKLLDKQLSKLKEISKSTDLNKLDLTLLVVVLRKSNFVHSPLWDSNVESYDWNTSISADIQRLKSYRNDIVAHIEQAKISSDIFENLWKEVKMLLCKIASRCGHNFETIISREIDQMKNDLLEPHRVSELRQEFITWCKNDIKVELPEVFQCQGMLESIQKAEQNFLGSREGTLRDRAQKESEKEEAEQLYQMVQWYYEEITTEEPKLTPYDKLINLKMEKAFKNGDQFLELPDSTNDTVYIIDFKSYTEYLKGDVDDSVKIVRKDILKAKAGALPETWDEKMQGKENLKRVNLLNPSPEYQQLESIFLREAKTGPYSNRVPNVQNIKVVKIERIQNKTLYQQYSAKKKLMETKYKDKPNVTIERKVWHGTPYDSVDGICTHGFNRSYCGKNGVWFGHGVYFATNASYSARGWLAAGNQMPAPGTKQYIFYVSVGVGEYVQGNKNMRVLPAKNNSNPTDVYDSAVNDVNSVEEIVIFNDTQAYPDYLITFTS